MMPGRIPFRDLLCAVSRDGSGIGAEFHTQKHRSPGNGSERPIRKGAGLAPLFNGYSFLTSSPSLTHRQNRLTSSLCFVERPT